MKNSSGSTKVTLRQVLYYKYLTKQKFHFWHQETNSDVLCLGYALSKNLDLIIANISTIVKDNKEDYEGIVCGM